MTAPWILVQARMGSTRLPGKVLRPIAGKPLLAWQLERLGQVKRATGVAVLATTNPLDDPLVDAVQAWGFSVFRGDEANVLGRYTLGARHFGAQTLMRVCSDAPLIDPAQLDDLIAFFEAGQYDYAHNDGGPTRYLPLGLGAEILTQGALEIAFQNAAAPDALEHVTPYLYQNPQQFKLGTMTHEANHSQHRWTVDTPEDFDLISRLLTELAPQHPYFSMADVLDVLNAHPDWADLNAHVVQKTVSPSPFTP